MHLRNSFNTDITGISNALGLISDYALKFISSEKSLPTPHTWLIQAVGYMGILMEESEQKQKPREL